MGKRKTKLTFEVIVPLNVLLGITNGFGKAY